MGNICEIFSNNRARYYERETMHSNYINTGIPIATPVFDISNNKTVEGIVVEPPTYREIEKMNYQNTNQYTNTSYPYTNTYPNNNQYPNNNMHYVNQYPHPPNILYVNQPQPIYYNDPGISMMNGFVGGMIMGELLDCE